MAIDFSTMLRSYPQELFIHWKDDVVNVRQLYRERKYRRCAILCSELLKEARHPIHKTFLHFYQAICYESLGNIAHNYSRSKIPLLEQARDAFILASEMSPNPDPNSINDDPTNVECSPVCATMDIAVLYGTPAPSSSYTTRIVQLADTQEHQDDYNLAPAPRCLMTNTYSTTEFDDYSPHQDLHSTENSQNEPERSLLTPNQTGPFIHNHKNRLSRSLSSKHALAEELVPSPLFSRGPSSKKESRASSLEPSSPTTHRQLTMVALCKPLPPFPPDRPLPHLPFNHNPYFIRKGKRFVVVPRRKTALSTLISKFEKNGPFSDTCSPTNETCGQELADPRGQTFDKTPVTERFNKISAVFVEKINGKARSQYNTTPQPQSSSRDSDTTNENLDVEENYAHSDKENIDPSNPPNTSRPYTSNLDLETPKSYPCSPVTPCPRPKPITRNRSPSQSSTTTTSKPAPSTSTPSPPPPYYPTISSSISISPYTHHLTTLAPLLNSHITTITHTITHTKTLQSAHDHEKRARFAKTHARTPTSNPTRPAKPLHSFWSLQCVDQHDRTTRKGKDAGESVKDERRKERIRKLKEGGWDVRKEKVGFKGVEYYSGLVGVVDREIEREIEMS